MENFDNLFKSVVEVIADTVGFPPGQIKPESSLREDLGADSLDSVEIVMQLEDKFDFRLPEEGEKIRTVGDLVNFIAAAQAARNLTEITA
jgi:acyl carrier protein